jgi:aryl-alcohol dehydrogenase-like predicted oxidoreductase
VRISALAALAAARSAAPPALSSDNLSLGFPNFEIWPNVEHCCDAETRSWYRSRQYPLLTWGCMGYGLLGDMDPSDADRRERVSRVYGSPRNRERLKRAGEAAAASGLSRAQIGWLWVLAQSLNLYPICGAHTIAQLKAAFALEGTTLSAAVARWLNLETDAPPEAREILARSPSRP